MADETHRKFYFVLQVTAPRERAEADVSSAINEALEQARLHYEDWLIGHAGIAEIERVPAPRRIVPSI